MSVQEAAIIWVGVALIVLTLIDLLIVRRWVRFDRTQAAWARLFVHDFAIYTLLLIACIVVISAGSWVDFKRLIVNWDWPLTFANIVLGILFRWLLAGHFRRQKGLAPTTGLSRSNSVAK